MSLYIAPDIRTQTIEQAEDHLRGIRVRRMVSMSMFQQSQSTKLEKLTEAEQLAFAKRKEKVDKANQKAQDAIEALDAAIKNLTVTHNKLTNIENEQKLIQL